MRILLYEFVHAGGWRALGWDPPPESLRREGAAMLAAVAEDFSAIDGVEIVIAADEPSGATGGLAASVCLACDFDGTLLIAPETGGALHDLCCAVESTGGRLLGPSSEFVRLATDKHRTAEHLTAAGIAMPQGTLLPPQAPLPRDFDYPAVLKPVDGAGSQDTWLVDEPDASCGDVTLAHNQLPRRLERYCPGTPASVAVLCGATAIVPLIPSRQRLSDDGRFRYLGGELPLRDQLAARATALALRAIGALPPTRGYVGVDLVMGDDPSGASDVVIEVNPRLTTSYVGLRGLSRQNLALAMLEVANGVVTNLSWRAGALQFSADGRVAPADEPPVASGNIRRIP